MEELSFIHSEFNQIKLHILPTEQFKTNTIVVNIQQSLDEDTVTKTALLPYVMNRGCETFPTTRQVKEKLDDLFGSAFEVHVFKKGERQIIQFRLDIANEKYLSDSTPLLNQGIGFMGDMLFKPLTESGAFHSAFMKTEKETLRKKIESLIDDKMQYANKRVTEEMCHDEAFRLFALGSKKDLPDISGEDLLQYYQSLLERNPIDIYVVGDVEPEQVSAQLKDVFSAVHREQTVGLKETSVLHEVKEEREIVERLEVKQGKLNIGCRTQINYAHSDYVPLLMYNGVLGGFPHSKLFVNVREKQSLAYYAVSRLESHKGIMMIMSGIETANYKKAVDIIKKQLSDMQEGHFNEEEIQQTKATLTNQLKERMDSPAGIIDFVYNNVISGKTRTLDNLLQSITDVTPEDIKKVAGKVDVDTIYFLRDREEM